MTESTLTIKDIAKYLNVTERTIYNLLDQRELPGFKVGSNWIFRKEDINKWIEDGKINENKAARKPIYVSAHKAERKSSR